MTHRTIVADDRGVAAIEFAIILPVLLGLLGGLFAYGRVLFVQQAVRDVIDDGVRAGVLTEATADTVETQIEASIDAIPGIEEHTVSVTDGAYLAVSVSGSFEFPLAGLMPQDALTFSMTTQFPR